MIKFEGTGSHITVTRDGKWIGFLTRMSRKTTGLCAERTIVYDGRVDGIDVRANTKTKIRHLIKQHKETTP